MIDKVLAAAIAAGDGAVTVMGPGRRSTGRRGMGSGAAIDPGAAAREAGAAIDRAQRYREAGADMLFMDALARWDYIERAASALADGADPVRQG